MSRVVIFDAPAVHLEYAAYGVVELPAARTTLTTGVWRRRRRIRSERRDRDSK